MSDVIERLRQTDADSAAEGRAQGMKWARERATAAQLRRLARFQLRLSEYDDSSSVAERFAAAVLCHGDCIGEMAYGEWLRQGFRESQLDDLWVTAFAEGAAEVWDAVRKHV